MSTIDPKVVQFLDTLSRELEKDIEFEDEVARAVREPIEDVRAWLQARNIDPHPLAEKIKAMVNGTKSFTVRTSQQTPRSTAAVVRPPTTSRGSGEHPRPRSGD